MDEFDKLLGLGDEDDDGILDEEDEDFVEEVEGNELVSEIGSANAGQESGFVSSDSSSSRKSSKKKIFLNETNQITDTSVGKTGKSTIENIARAFQSHEGWFPPGKNWPRGSPSYRNNNPGNLKFVGQAGAQGKDERGFAIFPSFALGWSALLRDISIKLKRTPGHSILSLITEYEGGDPENPPGNDLAYAKDVAKQLTEAVGKSITIHTKINNV